MNMRQELSTIEQGIEDIKTTMEKSYTAIESALPEKYKKHHETQA